MRRLVLALLILLLFGSAQAQTDPQGHQHMEALYSAYEEAMITSNPANYQMLFAQNPSLTKRAFVSCLEYAGSLEDEGAVAVAFQFAAQLADDIATAFGDEAPQNILVAFMQGLDASPQLEAYAVALYPGYGDGVAQNPPSTTGGPPVTSGGPPVSSTGPSATNSDSDSDSYTADQTRASDATPESLRVFKPILTKASRILIAMSLRDHELTIEEIDSYEQVVDTLREQARSFGLEGELEFLDEVEPAIKLIALLAYADVGLLQDFDAGASELLESNDDPGNHLSMALHGFRVAYRQQRTGDAKRYLKRATDTVQRANGQVSPVLLYSARTAEHQLAQLEGVEPTPQQTISAFEYAWSALDPYRALVSPDDDANWAIGGNSTRFWVEELVRQGPAAEAKLVQVGNAMETWSTAFESFTALQSYSAEDMLFHSDELYSMLTLRVAVLDQLTYMLERSPLVRRETSLAPGDLEVLTPVLQEFRALPTFLGLDLGLPGVGPLDLEAGNSLNEIEARIKLIEARISPLSVPQRRGMLEESMVSIEKTANPPVIVAHAISVGEVAQEMGLSELAVDTWNKALEGAEQLNLVGLSIRASRLLAQEYGRQKNWTEAAKHADKANTEIQKAVPLMGNNSQAIAQASQQSQELASLSAKAAIASNEPEKAFAALAQGQQMKAATVQLKAKKAAVPEVAVVKQKETEVTALTQQVNKLKAMPASATRNKMLAKTQKLLADSKSEFLLKSREIRRKHSGLYTKALKFDPLNLPDVQRALPPEVAVVQYFPTEEGTYIFVVTKESFRLRSVAAKKKSLDKTVMKYSRRVRRSRQSDPKLDAISKELYEVLVTPVAEDIKGKSTIVFIPSGRLNLLPFAALLAPDGQPLIADKMVLELAKPTDFMRIAGTKPKPVKSVVAFANATNDLPAAAAEGESIAKLFPESKLFKGKEANKKNFFAFGGKAEVLHLATHGSSDTRNSLNNYLAMADKQKVAQTEIFDLGLEGTSIVTLSACDTALSDRTDVSYVASLAEAFWIAGSHSVVASLWKVDDESTSLLMSEFYKGLRAGKSKAAALRAAQNAVRANPKFAHPYYWSAFMLFGDWR